jgi:hypothetical protein
MINSLPELNMLTSRSTNEEFRGVAYEMSLVGDATGDRPFTVSDLEKLLRPHDIDAASLSGRLWNLMDTALDPNGASINPSNVNADSFWISDTIVEDRHKLFTTHSFEVPMISGNFVERLIDKIEDPLASGGGGVTSPNSHNVARLLRLQAPALPTGQYAFAPELSARLETATTAVTWTRLSITLEKN